MCNHFNFLILYCIFSFRSAGLTNTEKCVIYILDTEIEVVVYNEEFLYPPNYSAEIALQHGVMWFRRYNPMSSSSPFSGGSRVCFRSYTYDLIRIVKGTGYTFMSFWSTPLPWRIHNLRRKSLP